MGTETPKGLIKPATMSDEEWEWLVATIEIQTSLKVSQVESVEVSTDHRTGKLEMVVRALPFAFTVERRL